MPNFSDASRNKLGDCETALQEVAFEAIKIIDFTIIEGHRNQERQEEMYTSGRSKVMFPEGKHNSLPSKAMDIAPYPVDWSDLNRFYYLAGVMKGIAAIRGINLRWGGDWDGDNEFKDQTFDDLVHYELVD